MCGMKESSFYDSGWEEWNDMIYHSPAPRLRRVKVISWLRDLNPATLLDVGCGNGEFLREAGKAMPSARLAGADISPSVIESNRLRMPGVDFHVLDLDRGRLSAKFDAVVCMEVVEHCKRYEEAIKKLSDMTIKRLIITVPCGPLFELDRRVGHVRHFKAKEIVGAVEKAGLRPVVLQRWGFPFFNLYKHAININPDSMADKFLLSGKYTWQEKFISSAVYVSFLASLPWWGYQLFVVAEREKAR